MEEIWKDIQGFEGMYQISNKGRVKSLDRMTIKFDKFSWTVKGRVMVNRISGKDNNTYYRVDLSLNDIPHHRKIHRLVAQAFIPNPENKKCVNHLDGNKFNNNVENLEWATHSENNKHTYTLGFKHPRIKWVLDLQMGIYYESAKEAAKAKNLDRSYVCKMLRGIRPNKINLIYV